MWGGKPDLVMHPDIHTKANNRHHNKSISSGESLVAIQDYF